MRILEETVSSYFKDIQVNVLKNSYNFIYEVSPLKIPLLLKNELSTIYLRINKEAYDKLNETDEIKI